jgi:hypothetical protein
MKKHTIFTALLAILAIIFAVLYFLTPKTTLTKLQLRQAEINLKYNPDYFSTYEMKFYDRVKDTAEAKKNVLNYRKIVSNELSSWISYNSDSIRIYINTFDDFKRVKSVPPNMQWEVGFYSYFKDADKKLTDFYVIPTLVPIKGTAAKSIDMLNPSTKDETKYFDTASVLLYDFGDLHP